MAVVPCVAIGKTCEKAQEDGFSRRARERSEIWRLVIRYKIAHWRSSVIGRWKALHPLPHQITLNEINWPTTVRAWWLSKRQFGTGKCWAAADHRRRITIGTYTLANYSGTNQHTTVVQGNTPTQSQIKHWEWGEPRTSLGNGKSGTTFSGLRSPYNSATDRRHLHLQISGFSAAHWEIFQISMICTWQESINRLNHLSRWRKYGVVSERTSHSTKTELLLLK